MVAVPPPQARLNPSTVKRYSTPDVKPSKVTQPPVLNDHRWGVPDINLCWVTMVAVTRYCTRVGGGGGGLVK